MLSLTYTSRPTLNPPLRQQERGKDGERERERVRARGMGVHELDLLSLCNFFHLIKSVSLAHANVFIPRCLYNMVHYIIE